MSSKGMKTFFFRTLAISLICPNFEKILIFRQKTSQLRWKTHLQEIISFDMHSTANLPPFAANLPPLAILKKNQFFEKKNIFL